MPPHNVKSEVLNIRMSPLGKALLSSLQDYYGLSQSGVIEMLVRDRSREEDLWKSASELSEMPPERSSDQRGGRTKRR